MNLIGWSSIIAESYWVTRVFWVFQFCHWTVTQRPYCTTFLGLSMAAAAAAAAVVAAAAVAAAAAAAAAAA